MASSDSFSSDSEEEKCEVKQLSAEMPLSFDNEEAYIEKMSELMRLENRDPFGRKLTKLKIEGDCTFLVGKNYHVRGGIELKHRDGYKCTILS